MTRAIIIVQPAPDENIFPCTEVSALLLSTFVALYLLNAYKHPTIIGQTEYYSDGHDAEG